MQQTNEPGFATTEVRMEISIAAPIAAVWTALTTDIDHWWPKSFCVGKALRFVLEPVVGGRMYEDWGDGGGLLWAHVVAVRAPELLMTHGALAPEFGGPAHHFGRYELKAQGAGTLLMFRDVSAGQRAPGQCAEIEDGWKLLLEQCLKAFCEGRPTPP